MVPWLGRVHAGAFEAPGLPAQVAPHVAPGNQAGVLDLAKLAQPASMTRRVTDVESELRYAVLRVDLLVLPGETTPTA